MDKSKVFLTGGSGGLGIPVTMRLLKDGWEVHAIVHSEKSKGSMVENFKNEVEQGKLLLYIGDVTKEENIKKVAQEIGTPSALVHLAGGFKGGKQIDDYTSEDAAKIFALNFSTTFLLLKTFLPLMKNNKKGRIVTIGAKPALYPGGENAIYAASKAALTNLTLSAAEEGRKYAVQANVIVPAVIKTAENLKWVDENTTTSHWTPPEDIADTISWLLSHAGSAITGTIFPMYHKMSTF